MEPVRRSLLLPALVLLGACSAPEGPPKRTAPPPLEEEARQAQALEAAKKNAREAAVEDLYRQWRGEYLAFAQKVEAVRAARREEEPASPVRSLDELLRETDPQFEEPAAREAYRSWLSASETFRDRLRTMQNDPEADPRSPLLPEVREALREQVGLPPEKAEQADGAGD